MATKTLTKAETKAAAAKAAAAAASKELAARVATDITEAQSVATLKAAFTKAREDYDVADDKRKAAAAVMDSAQVWMARIGYMTSIHPAVSGAVGKQNISAAARELGMPYGTLRPYVLAGEALARVDRIGILAEPTAEDIKAVKASIEETANARRRELAQKERERAIADKQRLAELEAANAQNGNGSAPTAPTAPTGTATDTSAPSADSSAPSAPATVPATVPTVVVPGPTLADDTLATAKLLVKQIAALRKSKEWAGISAKVVGILGQSFPILTK